MRTSFVPAGLLCLLLVGGASLRGENKPLVVEEGRYSIHLLLHTIGTESYTVTETAPGRLVMTTTSTSSDRGMKRTTDTRLEMGPSFVPAVLEQRASGSTGSSGSSGGSAEDVSRTEVKGSSVTGVVSVTERGVGRTMRRPPVAFVGFGSMPASLQMMMMRYWRLHHQPVRLPILRASEKALPLQIKLVGHDSFSVEEGWSA
jgi:hypothetical protein